MLLETTERNRFIEYCRQQIVSGEAILPQFEKLPMMEVVAKAENAKLLAYKVVLRDLESMEIMTIG